MQTVPVKVLAVLLFGLCLPMAAELRGDTIILRNGKRIQGRIITQNRILVIINTAGLRRQIRKDRIRRIRYDSTTTPVRRAADRRREKARGLALRRKARARREAARREAARREEARKEAARESARKRAVRASNGAAPGEYDGLNRLLKSAVLPGWGSYDGGRSMAGAFWLGGFVGAMGLAAGSANRFARLRDATSAENTLWNGLSMNGDSNLMALNILTRRERFAALDRAGAQWRTGATVLALVYVMNLIDAFFISGTSPRRITGVSDHGDRSTGFTILPVMDAGAGSISSRQGRRESGLEARFSFRLGVGK